MTKDKMIEKDLRRIVRSCWSGWIDWLEPRGAAGIGRPDADLIVDGVIAPVELKIGLLVEFGESKSCWVRPSKIRPDQISWSHRFKSAGGTSFWLFASSPTHLVLAWHLIDHRLNYTEFKFEQYAVIDKSQFTHDVIEFVRRARLRK